MIKFDERRVCRHALRAPPSLGVRIATVSGFAQPSVCAELIRLAEIEGFQREAVVGRMPGHTYPQATIDLEVDKVPRIRAYLVEELGFMEELVKAMLKTHAQRPIGFDDVFPQKT